MAILGGLKPSQLDSSTISAFQDVLKIKPTNVTYTELVTLIGSSGLTEGTYYKIIDYRTVHYMMDYLSGFLSAIETDINIGDLEPLIIQATSYNTLSPVAYSEQYPYDIIHYDWNPDNWLEDISFGGNAGSEIIEGFKGVIYFRHDTLHDNYMGYDFRKVKFRRWNNGSVVGTVWISKYQAFSSEAEGVTDTEDYIDVLTFNCPGSEEQYNNEVQGMHFKSFRENNTSYWVNKSILSNNVFHLEVDYGWFQVYQCEFEGLCGCNTFNSYVAGITAGFYFCENIIGNNFYDNHIGNFFNNNIVKDYFTYNDIGEIMSANVIGSNFESNVVKGFFTSSTIGDNFKANIVDKNFGRLSASPWYAPNTIGNNIHDCTFGSSLWYSTIGDDCYNLTIGNGCQHIEIGNKCYNIEIGNGSSYIEIANDSSATIGSGDISIGQDCGLTANMAIIIGDGCFGIKIGDGCTDIIVGNGALSLTLGIFCGGIYLPNNCIANDFKDYIYYQDFTYSGITQITTECSITHQAGSDGNIYQTYIDASGTPTMVITTNTIGVYT